MSPILIFIIVLLLLLIAAFLLSGRKEHARKEAESLLQNLSEAINRMNCIIEFDPEGNILAANDNFLRLFGYAPSELVGQHHSILFTPEQLTAGAHDTFWDNLKKGTFHTGEFERMTKRGDKIWISGSYNKIYGPDGKLIRILKIVTDITRRKLLEYEINKMNGELVKEVADKTAEVAEGERRYELIVRNMQEGIQVISHDWKYLYLNAAVVAQGKATREELLGHTMMEMYPGIENTQMFAALQRCMKQRVPEIIENEFTFPGGESEWFQLSIQPVAEGLLILSMDISKRKHDEERLRKYALELETSNTQLERFAHVASHDLQEPLRMVSSFLSLLATRLNDKLDDQSRQYINFALDGAERMKILIRDLLAYSGINYKKEDFKPVDLNVVLQHVQQDLAERIAETGAIISVEPLPIINGLQPLLNQLWQNLLANAFKYCKGKPAIAIGFNEEPGCFVFYIKDNGIGIDSRYFEKIFIIFQRLHNRSEYSGTGIGLAISRKIVEIHGGKIWVESVPGQGSTFYFTIPKL